MMLINELPDDCLLTIFDHFDLFDEFFGLSKVCAKWNRLVVTKLFKIKCLQQHFPLQPAPRFSNRDRTICVENSKILECSGVLDLLPNIEVLDITHSRAFWVSNKLVDILEEHPTIRGLIHPLSIPDVPQRLDNVEMVVANCLNSNFNQIYDLKKMKQLYLYAFDLPGLSDYSKHFMNLTRLHIQLPIVSTGRDVFRFYQGPPLPNLKILEVLTVIHPKDFSGYRFMDYCPALESAFFKNASENIIMPSIKNHLKDLVIEHTSGYRHKWPSLLKLLSKFPSLNHLALRRDDEINDDNVKELVALLPDIKLMDFRESPKVTKKSANYVERLRKDSGQSISLYYDCDGDEPPDWPKFGDFNGLISYGFDFMGQCFFKYEHQLPWLMIECN